MHNAYGYYGYMNSAQQTQIAFGTNKNGKRCAYRISYKFCPMRYFKMRMTDALAMLADGSAIEVEYMPWGGKECKASVAAMLTLSTMPTTGTIQ
jgi:hypothetical protein